MNHFKAVIFDMDGLLLDTETIAISTFVEACRECGFEPDLKVYYECIGTTYTRTREILIEGYGNGFDFDTISERWNRKFESQTENNPVPFKDGVLSLLHHLEKRKMTLAVVTSTRRAKAVKELANSGILSFFQFVLGGDQISRGKPDPEIYIKACRELNLDASQCLAIEDSDNGVQAAFQAGLTVIQVPDIVEPSDGVKALGHRIVRSLADVEQIL